jgi:hypothetical protein
LPGISDLLLLSPPSGVVGEDVLPSIETDSLELHLGRVLPNFEVEGDSVEVAWEVYGIEVGGGSVHFTLSVAPDDKSGIRRALEFLRVVSPDPPIHLSWEEDLQRDPASESGAPLFRRLTLDLSNLPEGRSRIRIEMRLPGREAVASELSINRTRSRR